MKVSNPKFGHKLQASFIFPEFEFYNTRYAAPVVQSVASLTADPWVLSSISTRSHTFVEIDHEIISSHSPPSAALKKGCCQLQVKVSAGSTG